MMRPGLWTGFFLEEPRECNLPNLLENINRLKDSGYECGEMDERNAYALFVSCTQEVADFNAKTLASLQFFSQLHSPKPNDRLDDQELCENRILRACSTLGIRTVVMHPFVASSMEDEPKEKNTALLSRYVEKAKAYGIRIALENQIYPVDMDYYLSHVSGLYVNIDFAHALATGHDIVNYIDQYKDRLAGLHVSDSDGRPEDYHIMPGKGVVDWKSVLNLLKTTSYDGDFHLEIVHERSTEADENLQTVRQSFDIIMRMIGGVFE